MNKKDCNTFEISAKQLMDECPSCGAQFEHLSTDARVYGVIALLVVFGISLFCFQQDERKRQYTTPKFQLIYVKVLIPLCR